MMPMFSWPAWERNPPSLGMSYFVSYSMASHCKSLRGYLEFEGAEMSLVANLHTRVIAIWRIMAPFSVTKAH